MKAGRPIADDVLRAEKKRPEGVLRATFDLVPGEGEERAPQILRAGGKLVTPALRDELLAKLAAGQHVEVELDIMPFRQRAGEPNRNFVRFREGGMRAMGRTGKGMPFLRDHQQGNSLAVGGEITASKLEPEVVGGGVEWRLHQTVTLSAPWAVDLALRGLIKFFSIGWDPKGDVLCSACGKSYYDWGPDGCRHYRGQELEDGTVVELEYQDALLVETSCVPVPAVLGTEVEDIRAALSAGGNGADRPREDNMQLLSALASILGLAATASEADVTKAVESMKEREKLLATARDEAAARAVAAEAKLAAHETLLEKQAEDAFIAAGIASGKIALGSKFETSLRAYYKTDAAGAKALLESSPVVTPVGAPRQSEKPGPTDSPAGQAAAIAASQIQQYNPAASLDGVIAALVAGGYTHAQATEMAAKHLGKEG